MNKLFDSSGYIKINEFVDQRTIQTISKYLENKIRRGEWEPRLKSKEDASQYGYYADPLVEVILEEFKPLVEQHTGLRLEPSYSFSRVYQGGEELTPHTDRPSCEISVTINVACKGDIWPLWVQYKDHDPVKLMLNPGDAVIYKGCETTHWRRELPKSCINVQFMLHYVIKDGQNAAYKFDQRSSLGLASSARRN